MATNMDSQQVKALWTKYLTQYKGVKQDLVKKIIQALKEGKVVYIIPDGKIHDSAVPGSTKIDLRDGLSQKEAKALGLTAKQADQIAAQGWALTDDKGVQTGDSAKVLDVSELAKFDAAIQKFANANGWSFEEALQAYYADNTKFGRIDTEARKENRVKTEAELLKGLKKVTKADQFTAYLKETLKLQDNNPILANLKAFDFSKAADRQKAIAYIIKLATGSEWSKDFQVNVLKFAEAIQTQYSGQLDLASIKVWAPTAKAYGDVRPAVAPPDAPKAGEPAKQPGTMPPDAPKAAELAEARKKQAEEPIKIAKGLIGKLEKADDTQINFAIAKLESSYGKKTEFKLALQALNSLIEIKKAAIIEKEQAAKALVVQQSKARALAKAIEGRKSESKSILEQAKALQKKYETRGSKKSVKIAGQIKTAIALVEGSINTGKTFKKNLSRLKSFIAIKAAKLENIEKKEAALKMANAKKARTDRDAIFAGVEKKYDGLMKKLQTKSPAPEDQISALEEKMTELKAALIIGGDSFKVVLAELKTELETGQKMLSAATPKPKPEPEKPAVPVVAINTIVPVVRKPAAKPDPVKVFRQASKQLENATSVADIEGALTILRTVPEKEIRFYANVTEAMKKAETAIASLKKDSTSTNEYVKAAAVELQKQALECLRSACSSPSSFGGGSDAQRLDSYLKQIEIIAKIESQNLSLAKAYDAYSKQMPSSGLLDVYVDKILPKLSKGIELQQQAQAAQLKKAADQKKISDHKTALPKLLKKLDATENKELIALGKKLKNSLAKTNAGNLSVYEQLLKQTEADLSQWVNVAQEKMPVQYAIYRLKTDNGIKVLKVAGGIPRFIQGWMKVFDGVELSGKVKVRIKVNKGRIKILKFHMNGFQLSEVTEATDFLAKAVDQKYAKQFLEALLAKVKINGLKNGTYNLPLSFI